MLKTLLDYGSVWSCVLMKFKAIVVSLGQYLFLRVLKAFIYVDQASPALCNRGDTRLQSVVI